jgi:type III restriction enzyme
MCAVTSNPDGVAEPFEATVLSRVVDLIPELESAARKRGMSFDLRPFQDVALDQLSEAIGGWVKTVESRGRPPLNVDGEPIPLFSHLTAITGAGKTPILASVVGKIGPSIVLWTTNRSVVVDQTVEKLKTVYRHFLPAKTTVIAETPTPAEWSALMDDTEGTVIWCLTVSSWNDADANTKGTAEARLNIHRPQPDWAGELSPWDQLGDLNLRSRPLWVIYDESQGQTDVQLDQLLALHPISIIAASATPRFSKKIDEMRETLEHSDVWGPVAKAAIVEVKTVDVAKAGLLKGDIEMVDLNTDDESKVAAAVEQLRKVEEAASDNGVFLAPRAIYVTEESDRAHGEPRPVTIWRMLVERCGVDPKHIAVATSTKELPKGADRVTDLAQLRPRHRHIIFNKKFQEGWDDPEAYVAFFDGETKSATRVRQIIGRVIRQPNARPFDGVPTLNTAFLFVSSPDEKFRAIVENIRKNLVEEFGRNPETGEANVRVRTRSERPKIVLLREGLPELTLPVLMIGASGLDELFKPLASAGRRSYPPEDRDAPGQAVTLAFKLTDEELKLTQQIRDTGQHIRTRNRDFFLDRVRALSREAFQHLPETSLAGEMFDQTSATGSQAQRDLRELALNYVEGFEGRIRYQQSPDPASDTWRPKPLDPTRPATLAYNRSVHPLYVDAPSFLNNDEKAMAQALDAVDDGWWMRNPPTRGMGGYGVPLPVQVAGSQTFFPDFLWWIDGRAFALDTTGVHLLDAKVRGKLLALPNPTLALVTRGRVSVNLDTLEAKEGWTLVLAGPAGPRRTHHADLSALLQALRGA